LIRENLLRVQEIIQELASQSLRPPEEIKLIAVSKTYPIEQIMKVVEAEHCVFGENRVAEAVSKINDLKESSSNSPLEWHLIGHLQKNKTRFCPGNFQWIHSLDSQALAKCLESRYRAAEQEVKVLIQMNLTGEANKNGMHSYEEVLEVAEYLKNSSHLHLRGLMTIGKRGASERETRGVFETLRNHCETLRKELADPEIKELSMGMSSDYPWAIAEGATMLRVGSSIFGERVSK